MCTVYRKYTNPLHFVFKNIYWQQPNIVSKDFLVNNALLLGQSEPTALKGEQMKIAVLLAHPSPVFLVSPGCDILFALYSPLTKKEKKSTIVRERAGECIEALFCLLGAFIKAGICIIQAIDHPRI